MVNIPPKGQKAHSEVGIRVAEEDKRLLQFYSLDFFRFRGMRSLRRFPPRDDKS